MDEIEEDIGLAEHLLCPALPVPSSGPALVSVSDLDQMLLSPRSPQRGGIPWLAQAAQRSVRGAHWHWTSCLRHSHSPNARPA